jgi:hypothetical protein
MAKKVIVGVGRVVIPGRCDVCGYDDDWHADGRDVVYCGCSVCPECGDFDGHLVGCPEAVNVDDEGDETDYRTDVVGGL